LIVNIEELESSTEKELEYKIEEIIPELENNTPVKANLTVTSKGDTIFINGTVETTLQLECDRCLKVFDYNLKLDIDETFLKGHLIGENTREFEIKNGNFIEDLGGSIEIDLNDLIYQSIIINVPNKKLCDINCEGLEESAQYVKEKAEDPRLQIFKDLKDKL